MVTARVEEIDEIIGLEVGADDYIKKPFSPAVFVARVKTLLKRFSDEDPKIEIGDLEIDPEKMTVAKAGKKLKLTTTQFNILYTLASKPGKVFTRDEILDRAYDSSLPPDVLDRTVDAHIKAIRKLIEKDTKSPEFLLTVIGKGYKFNDDVS
jgi:two-component system alkaline phosphatase synthesis response regulator PhoP